MERMGIVVDGSHTGVGHLLPSARNYSSQGLWSQAQKEQIIVVAGIQCRCPKKYKDGYEEVKILYFSS